MLGCGVQVKSKANKDLASFDLNQLRWSKVILCTDADVDGFQIRTLLLTMIYRLTPALIEAGKVFIAESPLYEITSKTDTYFAYTEAEKQKFLDQLEAEGGRFTIQRSKGLGENEPDMMNLTTMNPQTRRLIKVMPTDMEKNCRDVRLAAGGQPKRPKGLHRGKRTLIFGCGGCFVTGFLPRKPPRAWLLFLIF